MIELYGEYGALGLICALFVYFIINLIKSQGAQSKVLEHIKVENAKQTETIDNLESILLKLLTRIDRDGDRQKSERDRRHEDMIGEISDIRSGISEIKGAVARINGK